MRRQLTGTVPVLMSAATTPDGTGPPGSHGTSELHLGQVTVTLRHVQLVVLGGGGV